MNIKNVKVFGLGLVQIILIIIILSRIIPNSLLLFDFQLIEIYLIVILYTISLVGVLFNKLFSYVLIAILALVDLIFGALQGELFIIAPILDIILGALSLSMIERRVRK